jgi:hypothetical protein
MTHRVSIQYSIELDNLESETDRLLKGIQGQICDLDGATDLTGSSLSIETVEALSSLQDKLRAISAAADDLQKIISGFLSFKLEGTQEVTPPHPDTTQDEEEPSLTTDEQTRLREQLNEYRKIIEHTALLQHPDAEIVDEELKRQKIESFKQEKPSTS